MQWSRVRGCTRGTMTSPNCASGSVIQGNWNSYGRFYPGRITGGSVNRWSVLYSDGARETTVSCARILGCECRGFTLPTCRAGLSQGITGNWQGFGDWYTARLTGGAVATGFTVTYVDGDVERNVPCARLRGCTCGAAPLCARNSRVEGNYQRAGRYYAAQITADDGTFFTLRYSDGDTEQRVTCDMVRGCRCGTRTLPLCRNGLTAVSNWEKRGDFYPGRICSTPAHNRMRFCYGDGDSENIDCTQIGQCRCSTAQSVTTVAPRRTTACRYRVGQTISGNWNGYGDWYPGAIQAVNAATCQYQVRYSDGDIERGVSETNVRVASTCQYRVGQRVQANWGGRGTWYTGRVCGRGTGACTWRVCFDDGDAEENVPDSRLRQPRR